MNDDKPKLALRVFKRTSKHLILLWRRAEGVDPMGAKVTFHELSDKAKDRGKAFQVPDEFVHIDEPLADSGEREVSINSETVICMIKEKDAGLDPTAIYYVKVAYGQDEEGIRITPAGVYPSHEKEDRQKNVHLMGWDDESQTWRKVSVVKGPKGRYCLATICGSCNQEQMED